MDCSPPGSSLHGILQVRILDWIAISPPGDLPDPEIEPVSPTYPALVGGFFITEPMIVVSSCKCSMVIFKC